MDLKTLIEQYPHPAHSSVPDWMIGTFKRRSISFANGLSDIDTHVFWLQSCNFSIDLRLPILASQLSKNTDIRQISHPELLVLAQYQGWCAPSVWNEHSQQLSWLAGTSLQLHTQWPEPGILSRIGNCMMEYAPSNFYIEDWRLQNTRDGALVGLLLEQEYDPATGQQYHASGGLIINGDYAGLVLGRPSVSQQRIQQQGKKLADLALAAQHDPEYNPEYNLQHTPEQLQQLFQFETSVAHGNINDGFQILMSTQPQRQSEQLFPLDGFEYTGNGKVTQTLMVGGQPRERIFRIDVIKPDFSYALGTPALNIAQQWYEEEAEWLTRYNQLVL